MLLIWCVARFRVTHLFRVGMNRDVIFAFLTENRGEVTGNVYSKLTMKNFFIKKNGMESVFLEKIKSFSQFCIEKAKLM